MSPEPASEAVVRVRREEIAESVRRLIAIACDESQVKPESADQYYLLYAIRELEKHAAALTPATLGIEEARYQLDMIFMWCDRKKDENKDEYRKAVDVLVAASRERAAALPPTDRDAVLQEAEKAMCADCRGSVPLTPSGRSHRYSPSYTRACRAYDIRVLRAAAPQQEKRTP